MSFLIDTVNGCDVCLLPIISLRISINDMSTRAACKGCIFGELVGLRDLIVMATRSRAEIK